MAVEKKQVFKQNLKSYSTFIQDTAANSTYFKVTELPDTLTGGKNAFLIEGSDLLQLGSEIKIEILDSTGVPVYIEAADGYATSSFDSNGNPIITEYYEGTSKIVSMYVYTDTSYGPAQITILGEAKYYLDQNNIKQEIPADWRGVYNVKWQKNLTINPSLPNTTKVRFYKRPTANITEILSPIYRIENGSKVASNVTASFANIILSQLDTFAGDVKRVKVFRTSAGDISDYDLIQDIYVESKELLTTLNISGSVKGEAGLLTADTLKNTWNTGSLNTYLTSSRIDNGCRLTGSGYFTFTGSLNISSTNVYELTLDAFYSSSTASNLGIYISGSNNGEILLASLNGITPVKNLENQLISFTLSNDEPSASLYLSQSQGEWHIGNLSLKLTEDTAFSPTEISFVTSMPTVIGNETYNFKFEFYDVNNNYVPVAVTQSATFTGGNNNIGGTITLISGSITEFSQSYFIDVYSGSSSLSGSLSSSISKSASEVSASSANYIVLVSGSLSSSISVVSGSQYILSQSVSTSLASLSASLSSSVFGQASQSLYQVYSASAFLDKFIYTDENGQINSPPTASGNGLYLGSTYLGYYSSSAWRTYMDDQGDFALAGADPNLGFLAWSSKLQRLQVQGDINIQGGNAATTTSVQTAAANAVTSGSNAATSVSNSLAPNIFTNANGLVNRPPATLVGVPSGLYLSPSYMGYYTGTNWNTYMGNDGKFFLTGSASNYLKWDGNVLTIAGAINITGGDAATKDYANASADASSSAVLTTATARLNASSSTLQTNITSVDDRVYTNTLGKIVKTPTPGTSAGLYLGKDNLGYYDSGKWSAFLSSSGVFYLTGSSGGNALLWDGQTLTIKGNLSVGSTVPNSTVQGLGDLALSSSVSENQIQAGAVTETKIGVGSVTNTKIGTDAVSEGKLATDAVTSGKIKANAIVADKIATGAIVADKIAAGAVVADKIAVNAITASQIQANAIIADKIAAGAIVADKIAAGAIVADKIAANAITASQIAANTITAGNISSLQFSGKDARFDSGSIGGWLLSNSQIYNTNVEIDNSNSRIDFKSGGVVKTRILSGNASIGSTNTAAVVIPAGTQNTDSGNPTSNPYYGIFTKSASSGGSDTTFYLYAPAGTTGNKFSIVVPYPGLSSVGYVQCGNLGGGTSWQYSYYARINYVVRENNSGGTIVASGYKYLVYSDWGINDPSPGDWIIDGFSAGTITIPNIGIATAGQTYWISLNLSTNASVRINPSGGTISNSAYLFARTNAWDAYSGNAILLAVAARAEYATNGAQIGSSEGTYVALGDAAGTGYVGQFAGNVQIIGVLSAGSVTASDKRAKTNVRQIENGIQTIKKLNPVSYDWLQHVTGNNEFEKGYGFIADEVENVLPHLIYEKKRLSI